MKLRLQAKIVGIVLLVSFIFFSVLAYSHIQNYKLVLEELHISKGRVIAQSLDASITGQADLEDKAKLMSNLQKHIWVNPNILRMNINLVEDNDLKIFASNKPKRMDQIPDEDNLNSYENNIINHKIIDDDESKILHVIAPAHLSGQTIGTYEIYFTMEEIDKAILEELKLIFLYYLFTAIGLISVMFLLLRIIIIRPISKISNAVKIIAKGNLDHKVIIRSKDELGKLATTFNKMGSNIKKYQAAIIKSREKKGKELSREVQHQTKQLVRSEKAAYNMMADINEVNQRLIKARAQISKNYKELKILDKQKDEFISITSHELKTPLTSIKGFIQLMQSKKVIHNKKKFKRYFELLAKETERLSKLVSDIMDLSRLDLKTLKLVYEDVKINDIVDSVEMMAGIKAQEKDIKIEKDIAMAPEIMKTDRNRMIQILFNLVINAINYSQAKGKIKIKVEEKGKTVLFSVSDQGTGIPKKDLKKIFERFQQVDSSLTRKIGGSGLGLSICQGLVERLGSKIHVKSQLGKSSTFYFSLPIKRERLKKAFEKKRKNNKGKKHDII